MPELNQIASQLKKLGSALETALKSRAQSKPNFGKKIEEAAKLAEQIGWPELVAELRRECEALRAQHDTSLQSRLEKLLQAARASNVPAEPGARSVRVDIFRVELEGATASISLGGAKVERAKETDGDKLFARLRKIREGLDQSPFNREDFFKLLKSSYASCRRGSATDEFVPVRELHRELMLERARQSEAFRRSPEPKNVPAYPLHQFVFDLARFIQKGVGVGEERLVTTVPSMRESANTVFIPNLDHPLGNETPAARLAIKRST